jgi:hypothetical protein
MSLENVAIVRSQIEAFNRRDMEAWNVLSHPDVEVDWSVSRGLEAGVYRGRYELRGGLIVHVRLCEDTAEALEAAGLPE